MRVCALSQRNGKKPRPPELANTLRKPLRKEVQFYIEPKARELFPVPGGRPDPILETNSSNRQLVGKAAHLCRWGIAKK
jgi:hypothetical protein